MENKDGVREVSRVEKKYSPNFFFFFLRKYSPNLIKHDPSFKPIGPKPLRKIGDANFPISY